MTKAYRLHAAIHSGPPVDDYLTREGAIAQAADRNTILLCSSVFGMSVSDRLVLLLHELAHLQQLANPGNDPVRALEDEAWDAAHAWTAGRLYRVRGRARRPLNALAIIQGGAKGHPSAPPWYSSNPVEPIGNGSTIIVKDVTVIESMTLESVMDVIIRGKNKEILLVCHGWADALAIPLMDGASSGAEQRHIFPLSADRSVEEKTAFGGSSKTPIISDKVVADQTRLSEEQVKKLRAKMNQIRSLKLEHVAFRACDLGQSTDTLQAFRNFLGAASVSAPKLFDTYGEFKPSMGRDVEDWAKHKRLKEGFRVWIDGQVAFGIKTARSSAIAYKIVCKAPNDKTFTAWVRAHVADQVGTDRLVVYHGMEDQTVANREAPIIYFVRDDSFIANIVFFAGGSP